jgi:dolichol-phosphate mannosyltransferase
MIRSNETEERIETACIVVPTYNEAGNITKLLDRIFENERKHAARTGIRLSVLVVDDNSPDGTAQLVRAYAKRNRNVRLLLRDEKQGLGAAYIAGMRHAMAVLNPDVLFEMDADFSHNPDDLYRLLAQVQKGVDFVIGSRYTDGGSIPADWGIKRKVISKAANLYTKTMLSLGDIKDCSGGFRAIRTDLLRRIDFDALHVKGYVFQVSLLSAAIQAGGIVAEVPIAFSDRNEGKSKMRLADMLEWGTTVLRIRMQSVFAKPMKPIERVPEKSIAMENATRDRQRASLET